MPLKFTNAEADLLARALRSHNTRALGNNTVTGLDEARALGYGGSIPAGTTRAIIDVEDNPIRFWLNGSSPTATAGHYAAVGDQIEVENGNEVQNFRAIEVAGDVTLQVTFFGGNE
jgi:hypothetical protein